MSPYGSTVQSASRTPDPLPSTLWHTGKADDHGGPDATVASGNRTSIGTHSIVVHHLTLETAKSYEGLLPYLSNVFLAILEEGITYPQEDMDEASFLSYFFAADVFVGVLRESGHPTSTGEQDATITPQKLEHSCDWSASIAGFYYVKPNYPGRSSHICNAGFVVPPRMRGQRYGVALAKSYLHYAPKLGYQASVFNLVYVNNVASVRIWEGLGFTKAGRIPSAGRLKSKSGEGEEYVDAWVFYKSFKESRS